MGLCSLPVIYLGGFPCGSTSKEYACNVKDLGSIPGLGRSPGERKGYSFQYSGLENSMDSPWGCKESDMTEQLSLHFRLWLEVMKIMAAYFKRSHVHTATLSAPNPEAGLHHFTPLPETPGHSWESLDQCLVGHCSFLPSPGAHKFLFVPSQSLFPSPV